MSCGSWSFQQNGATNRVSAVREDAALSSPTDAFVPAADGALWQTIAPAKAGFDPDRLKAAVDFAREQESPGIGRAHV